MNTKAPQTILVSDAVQKLSERQVSGDYVELYGESFYRIRNYDALEPFFLTLISSSNHWLFLSTTGGLSAGRIDAGHALFPYYTDDKITENSETTGAKAIFLVQNGGAKFLWEPFSRSYDGLYDIERSIYKNVPGTTVIFEELNRDLGLTYRYAWRSSDAYGFVKTSWLINQRAEPVAVELLDGLQNLLPANVSPAVQNEFSNLLDAYKISELHPVTGLAMFALSSRLTDMPEPSESLRVNTVWQTGLDDVSCYLLSSTQLDAFRKGAPLHQESRSRGRRGAYFVNTRLQLEPGAERSWHMVADVDQDRVTVTALINTLIADSATLSAKLEQDMLANTQQLETIIAQADGLQMTRDHLSTAHHFANVLFNVMRGGIFADHYQVETQDLRRYVESHHAPLLEKHADFFTSLPDRLALSDLHTQLAGKDDADLLRLCMSYLPLTFSRRHGDPSRPWNRFQINVKQADGSRKLDYQGNWRDIFQNWEALSFSYPEFLDGMIAVFLNATTLDGYNPYRLTRDGIDWETPEPSNAWANIGYWNDHQIIYLQKLLEASKRFHPGKLQTLLNQQIYSSANVPYRIKPYAEICEDPYHTIQFDWDAEAEIEARVREIGADGKLIQDQQGGVVHVSLAEKVLLLLLAKLTNFVPEGGVWLNTQRPEWNDANNALVGKGLSVVTLAYMRRAIAFFRSLVAESNVDALAMTEETISLFSALNDILESHKSVLPASFSDQQRRGMLDALGIAGSYYRQQVYEQGLSGTRKTIAASDLLAFLDLVQTYVEHTLRANRRNDGLYHSYNTLKFTRDGAVISNLSLMLEGQVAILSSGLLSADEALVLLRALRASALYRADQHSYILYPDRDLPGFLDKNNIDAEAVNASELLMSMLECDDKRLVLQDISGGYHFQGDIRNAADVARILKALGDEADYAELVKSEADRVLDLFEQVFNHDAFTGRSGTFFAYEGLGSIYWHMVSKLLLAVQENIPLATDATTRAELIHAYYDVRAGIGFNKSPDVYGAFPTDPYSHTPLGQGAKQPGMTGMVKEEVLTRMLELGIEVEDGCIAFNPILLRAEELLTAPGQFGFVDLDGSQRSVDVPAGCLAFTFCQVPLLVCRGDENVITVDYRDGNSTTFSADRLPAEISQNIFRRDGNVSKVTVTLSKIG